MKQRGLEYGGFFQQIDEIWHREGEAIARMRQVDSDGGGFTGHFRVHPGLLDSSIQVMGAALAGMVADGTVGETYVAVGWQEMRVYETPGETAQLWAHAVLESATGTDAAALVRGDVFLTDSDGIAFVEIRGVRLERLLENVASTPQDDAVDWFYEVQWTPQARAQGEVASGECDRSASGRWLVFSDRTGTGQALQEQMEREGTGCVLVGASDEYKTERSDQYCLNPRRPEDFQRLLKATIGSDPLAWRGVVHLWSLDVLAEPLTLSSIEEAQMQGAHSIMHLVQAMAQAGWRDWPRLYVVTSRAQCVAALDETATTVAAAPVLGLARAIAHEYPELRCTTVDIGDSNSAFELRSLFMEISADGLEHQIVLRGDDRFVARLAPCVDAASDGDEPTPPNPIASVSPFRLETSKAGSLDHLVLRENARRSPGPGEVEIRVAASGLNFRDVMKALGLYPREADDPVWFGDECAGEVVAIGDGVTNLRLGDRVVAVAPASFSTYVTAPAEFVARLPAPLDHEQGATLPIAFLTAYHCLHGLAGLIKGERILIHAAAGGVGLAAVQLALQAGAEVFATAGNSEKREFLRSLKITHVMDSRSADFAREVMRITGGEGVDIVLNSLSGDGISRGLSVLRSYGRFVEIGKRDIYQNLKIGLSPFRDNLSFFAVDMDRLVRQRPQYVSGLLRRLIGFFEDRTLESLPLTRFLISRAPDAFRHMAEARHIGKIVLSFEPQAVQVMPSETPFIPIRPDRSYLITGGLGGLGLAIAQWMIQKGAKRVFLMGRRKPSAAVRDQIASFRTGGAEVTVLSADVSEEEQVRSCLKTIEQSGVPLAGIIHAAAVFDDGLMLHCNEERFRAVTRPKVNGAWILHQLSANLPLDFFVLFSSIASIFGSHGQCSYCAGNAFLDALAHYRRKKGLPAVSINWGPWAELGRAAGHGPKQQLLGGTKSISPAKGLAALGRLLQSKKPQIAVVGLDPRRWLQLHPRMAELPFFENLTNANGSLRKPESEVKKALLALAPGPQRRSFLESHVGDQIASVLRIPRSSVEGRTPLATLGFESLMAVEFKNRIEDSLGVGLPATLVWGGHSTIAELSEHLAAKMSVSLDPPAPSPSPAPGLVPPDNLSSVLDALEALPEEDVRRLLDASP
jgi:NADPH:quinone reductase-like Zn-dependent oxidoreductase